MKKYGYLVPVLLLLASMISSCGVANIFMDTVQGSGEVVTEIRDVPNFSKIEAHGDFELFVTQIESGIEIHAEGNLMKYIHTYVEDQTLVVETANTDGSGINLKPLEPIEIYVKLTKITDISLTGGVKLNSGQLIAKDMQINLLLADGSEAKINALRTGTLNVTLLDQSSLEIVDGQVSDQTIKASKESKYLAEWLKSETTTMILGSGSEATIWAEETFEVDLTGGSTAYYYGSPNTLTEVKNAGGSDYVSKGER